MLYELAHVIKERCGFLWDIVERGNVALFAFFYRKKMKEIPNLLEKCSTPFVIRETTLMDVKSLVKFFADQPSDAYTFFKPHGFDEKSIEKVIRNKAFLTYIVLDGTIIVGYFFLRSFVNGKCFRGKMVDYRWRNKGIAKQMGIATNHIVNHLGLRMFASISPENYASLASSKAVNEVNIVKTLENGYYYIEYTPKL